MVGFEDLLFAFLIGGIASVIYEAIFKKRYVKKQGQKYPYWILAIIIFGFSWMIFGSIILKFNSIYVSIASFLMAGIPMLVFRNDLIENALLSGLLVAILMFIFYLFFLFLYPGIIQKWWLLSNISGILIFGAPLEELIWGFSWGFLAGPVYEFIYGLRFKKNR